MDYKSFLLIGLFTLIVSSSLYAQKTLIEYDFEKEDFVYYEVGKDGSKLELKSPAIHRNGTATLVIKNFNDFAYKCNVRITDVPISNEEFSTILGDLVGTDLSGSGFFDFSNFTGFPSFSDAFSSLFGGAFSGFAGEEEEFKMILDELELSDTYEAVLISEAKTIRDVQNDMFVLEVVNDELESLKQNPILPIDTIKQRSRSLMMQVLGAKPSIERIRDRAREMSLILQTGYEDFNTAFENFMIHGTLALSYCEAFLEKDIDFENYRLEIEKTKELLHKKINNAKAIQVEINSFMGREVSTNISNNLWNAYKSFDEILSHPFEYRVPININSELSTLEIEVMRNDSQRTQVRTVRSRIYQKGGVGLIRSAGLGFLSYSGGIKSFQNINGNIEQVSVDRFLPLFSTQIGIYRKSASMLKIGGTFGMGVSVDDQTKLAFTIGPALLIGDDQRVVVSAGAIGGKVDKLDEGFEVGDALTSPDAAVPIAQGYDFGYFIAVSINI